MSKVIGSDITLTWFWPEGVPRNIEPTKEKLGQLALTRPLTLTPSKNIITIGEQQYDYVRINAARNSIKAKLAKSSASSTLASLTRDPAMRLASLLAGFDLGLNVVLLHPDRALDEATLLSEARKISQTITDDTISRDQLATPVLGDVFNMKAQSSEQLQEENATDGSASIIIPTAERGFLLHREASLANAALSFSVFHDVKNSDRIVFAGDPVDWLGVFFTLVAMINGSEIFFCDRDNAKQFVRTVSSCEATLGVCGPTCMRSLLDLRPSTTAFASLRWIASVAGIHPPLPRDLQRNLSKMIGVPVIQMYGRPEFWVGMSVHSSWIVQNAIGVPLPGVTVAIVDPETHDDIPREAWMMVEKAELTVKGSTLLERFLDESNTRRYLKREWLHTSDLVEVDANGIFYPKEIRPR